MTTSPVMPGTGPFFGDCPVHLPYGIIHCPGIRSSRILQSGQSEQRTFLCVQQFCVLSSNQSLCTELLGVWQQDSQGNAEPDRAVGWIKYSMDGPGGKEELSIVWMDQGRGRG